jgi:hypothetical protein
VQSGCSEPGSKQIVPAVQQRFALSVQKHQEFTRSMLSL